MLYAKKVSFLRCKILTFFCVNKICAKSVGLVATTKTCIAQSASVYEPKKI